MLNIENKLIDVGTKELIGLVVSNGGTNTAPVSIEKAKELKVQDIEIIEYLETDIVDAVKLSDNSYGVASHGTFFDEYADSPIDYVGDKKLHWGYYFTRDCIVTLDSDYAINRMLNESKFEY